MPIGNCSDPCNYARASHLNDPTVLITGSTGFVGSHVVTRLKNDGVRLRLLVREPLRAPVQGDVVTGDLADENVLAKAVDGVHAVIHLAGRAHVRAGHAADRQFDRVNHTATAALADLAARAGVERFLFLSSMSAVAAPATPYGNSKRLAEDALRQSTRTRMHAIVLRPPVVYGPGMKGNPLKLFRWVSRRRPVPVVRGVRRSTLYIDNLVHVISRSLTIPLDGTRTFEVCDGPALELRQFVELAARALGVRPRLLELPAATIQKATSLTRMLPRVLNGAALADKLERLAESLEIDPGPQTSFFGNMPYTTEEGIAATGAWYRNHFASQAS